MEGLAAAASVIGIVSLAVQIVQRQIDEVRNADERLLQIVHEIRAIAADLSSPQDLLLDDEGKYPGGRVLNSRCHVDIKSLLDRCNAIFRNIAVLYRKLGSRYLLMLTTSSEE